MHVTEPKTARNFIKLIYMENYEPATNCNPNKEEKMALDRPYPKATHWCWTGTLRGLDFAVVTKRPGKGRLRMKQWKQGRHGARLKGWMLIGPGGGASRMPYGPEGATGSDDDVTQPDNGYVGLLMLQHSAVTVYSNVTCYTCSVLKLHICSLVLKFCSVYIHFM
jgi:hypothetical protein